MGADSGRRRGRSRIRHLSQWTIPHTEITLVRLKEGLREGQWVFSSETDERVAEFYERVKHLPYKPGASEGLYDLFVSEPGWMIPRELIRALPGWMQARYGGQTVWQWCALVLTLVVTAALMVLIYRVTGRLAGGRHGAGYYLGAVFPVFAVVLPQTATDFLSEQVFITGRLFEIVDFALDLVSLGALIVVILGLTNRLATALMALPWSKERQLTAQLAQLVVRAIGVAGALVAVFEGGRYLGVPLTTLVAGVSVSGLTVALAAQDTLKNLFGSLMILLDRPFQVGDLIRIKGTRRQSGVGGPSLHAHSRRQRTCREHLERRDGAARFEESQQSKSPATAGGAPPSRRYTTREDSALRRVRSRNSRKP